MGEDRDDTIVGPARPLPGADRVEGLSVDGNAVTRDWGPTVIVPRSVARHIDHATGRPVDEEDERDEPDAIRFYAMRLGSHDEVIVLDAPCIVGRRPSLPRIPSASTARLVTVASPRKEVSASHLEVRQIGSSVVVTDLKSTNGSVVIVPGSVPRKLRQGESVVVSPGTQVDIGDNNILQILPMQRPA